jgi:hypothetical protein
VQSIVASLEELSLLGGLGRLLGGLLGWSLLCLYHYLPPDSELNLMTASQNVEVSNKLPLYLVLSLFCCQVLF